MNGGKRGTGAKKGVTTGKGKNLPGTSAKKGVAGGGGRKPPPSDRLLGRQTPAAAATDAGRPRWVTPINAAALAFGGGLGFAADLLGAFGSSALLQSIVGGGMVVTGLAALLGARRLPWIKRPRIGGAALLGLGVVLLGTGMLTVSTEARKAEAAAMSETCATAQDYVNSAYAASVLLSASNGTETDQSKSATVRSDAALVRLGEAANRSDRDDVAGIVQKITLEAAATRGYQGVSVSSGISHVDALWSAFEELKQLCAEAGHAILASPGSPIPNDVKTVCGTYARMIALFMAPIEAQKNPTEEDKAQIITAIKIFTWQSFSVNNEEMYERARTFFKSTDAGGIDEFVHGAEQYRQGCIAHGYDVPELRLG